MKHFIAVLFFVFLCSSTTYSTPTSRSIIENNNDSSAYSEIKTKTSRDAQLNKVNNDLNIYRSRNDGFSNQKIIELEKQKIKIIHSK